MGDENLLDAAEGLPQRHRPGPTRVHGRFCRPGTLQHDPDDARTQD